MEEKGVNPFLYLKMERKGFALLVIIILLAVSFFAGYKYNDYNEQLTQEKKVIQIPTHIGPSGVIDREDISMMSNSVYIKINNPTLLEIDSTNSYSMLPFIDDKASILGTKDFSFDSLKVGDIIAYNYTEGNTSFIVSHAIVSINSDEQGKYLITRGYNLYKSDNVKVRDKDVIYKITGVLYGSK